MFIGFTRISILQAGVPVVRHNVGIPASKSLLSVADMLKLFQKNYTAGTLELRGGFKLYVITGSDHI
jgi:hypothetical protein